MLYANLLAADLNSLCQLIDTNSDEGAFDEFVNFTINEALAYVKQSLLPTVLKSKRELLQEAEFQDALINFVDIIALRWSTEKLDKVRRSDPEEFQYQEELMGQYAGLCLLIMQ